MLTFYKKEYESSDDETLNLGPQKEAITNQRSESLGLIGEIKKAKHLGISKDQPKLIKKMEQKH